jgi:hypothetical protein
LAPDNACAILAGLDPALQAAHESRSPMPKQSHKTLSAAQVAKGQLIDKYQLEDRPGFDEAVVGLVAGDYVIRVKLTRPDYVYLPADFGGYKVVKEIAGRVEDA